MNWMHLKDLQAGEVVLVAHYHDHEWQTRRDIVRRVCKTFIELYSGYRYSTKTGTQKVVAAAPEFEPSYLEGKERHPFSPDNLPYFITSALVNYKKQHGHDFRNS